MNLQYTSDKNTHIHVILDIYDVLGDFVGPIDFLVPAIVGNREYDLIIKKNLKINDYVVPPPKVPDYVTPLQARKILRLLGYLDDLELLMEESTPEVRDAWEYATVIERHNPLILEFAEELELDENDVDLLFIEAAKL